MESLAIPISRNNIASDIQEFHTKELEFQEFGEKAKLIKENKCDISDFVAFTESLELNMTNRRLYPLQLLSAYHLAFSQNACNFSVPGAGKTSIVYHLANLINQGKVSEKLKNKVIYELDISSIIAGTKYRGQFEERLKTILNELSRNNNIILFYDSSSILVKTFNAFKRHFVV